MENIVPEVSRADPGNALRECSRSTNASSPSAYDTNRRDLVGAGIGEEGEEEMEEAEGEEEREEEEEEGERHEMWCVTSSANSTLDVNASNVSALPSACLRIAPAYAEMEELGSGR